MSQDKTQKSEREIYASAVKIENALARQEFLAEACGEDEPLRERIDKLLAAKFDNGDNLLAAAAPASGVGEVDDSKLHPSSTRGQQNDAKPQQPVIDRYRIIEEIGQGGMGTVYMAEQREPVRRKVALKVIKRGMDSEQVVARFEAERQALALMNHPNIAGVLDAGMTEDGRPFFVMELVRGIPVNEYCDRHKLTRDERLKLFQAVCQAVQHAHQKGIIHRDLKPSNILVELHDVSHVPKVIDFGVAKATSQRLTDKTLYTMFSQMIGTPLYMSPEQAELSGLDVDTRSDIYSLGVLLYELLTGTTPFDRETFQQASLDEMRRIIREDEPLRPSQKISTLNREQASTIAEKQSTDVRSLTGRPVQELDWIVVKTLEKDRSRRYESASALATDVGRYLGNETVLACPPSLAYQLRKFASRRRGVLASAALVAVSMFSAIGVSLRYAAVAQESSRQATTAKDEIERKNNLLQKEIQAKNQALSSLLEANAETKAVFDYLVEDLLEAASPGQAEGRQILLVDAVANIGANVDNAFKDQPKLRASAKHALGRVFSDLGKRDAARDSYFESYELRKQHIGENAKETLDSYVRYADALERLGRHDEAQKILEAVVAKNDNGNALYPNVGAARINLATVYIGQGDYTKARKLLTELTELTHGEDSDFKENVAIGLNNLGHLLVLEGNPESAETHLRQAEQLFQELHGPKHPTTLKVKYHIARALKAQGRAEQALKLFEEVLETQILVLGDLHASTEATAIEIVSIRRDAGQLDSAIRFFEEKLETARRNFGEDHPAAAKWIVQMAYVEKLRGDFVKATEYYSRAEAIYRAASDEKYFAQHLSTLLNLGTALQSLTKFERASEVQAATLALQEGRRESHPEDVKNLIGLGGTYCNMGNLEGQNERYREALPHFENAVEVLSVVLEKSPNIERARKYLVNSYSGLAICNRGLDDFDAALQHLALAAEVAPEAMALQIEFRIAVTQANQGNYQAALDKAISCAARGNLGPGEYYNLALVYSKVASHSEDHTDAEKLEFQDAAINALTQADNGDFFQSPLRKELLLSDSFLKLRQDERFRELARKHELIEALETLEKDH